MELDVSTFEITFLGSFANIPEFSRFNTLGTFILNGDDVAVTVPVLIPTTSDVAPRVKSFPLEDISVILLKTTSS